MIGFEILKYKYSSEQRKSDKLRKTTFIYCLIDPITKKVRYIGKSDNPHKRLRDHIKSCCRLKNTNNAYCGRWIKKLFDQNMIPYYCILEECDKAIWQKREKYWIAFGKIINWNLTNETDGGDSYDWTGRSLTEEHKKCLRESHLGEKNGMFGKHLSQKHKRCISKKLKGRKFTIEHRQKIGMSQKGRKYSEERRKNMSIGKANARKRRELCHV